MKKIVTIVFFVVFTTAPGKWLAKFQSRYFLWAHPEPNIGKKRIIPDKFEECFFLKMLIPYAKFIDPIISK